MDVQFIKLRSNFCCEVRTGKFTCPGCASWQKDIEDIYNMYIKINPLYLMSNIMSEGGAGANVKK